MTIQENYINKKSKEALFINTEENQHNVQNKKLIENEELAWSQHERLENAKRDVIEIDNVGINIMRDMENQTSKMNHISNKLGGMNVEIDHSSNLLTRMMNRENRNKTIVIFFSILVVISFLIILLVKFV
jgi:vesicle transport through interaction with t-SNAREs protein 1